MERKITIKDIARELKIHHTTVSRALRNDPRIKDETRKRIITFANEKGYQVNQSALNFRNKQSNEIAIVVPNIGHYTFSNFISRVTDLAQDSGFVVSVFQSKEDYENEKNVIQILMQNRVAGVIASISNSTVDTSHFKRLKDFGIPLVFFDRVAQDIETSKVIANNYDAAYDAVKYLAKKGYRRIVHLTGPAYINVFSDRNDGYQSALKELGLTYSLRYEVSKSFVLNDGIKFMKEVWGHTMRPDAILCDSFTLSAGINSFCSENRIHIPRDLAIIAIANDPFSALIEPPQTVMEQPIDEIANSAFDLLLKSIKEKGNAVPEIKHHKTRLIERKSV